MTITEYAAISAAIAYVTATAHKIGSWFYQEWKWAKQEAAEAAAEAKKVAAAAEADAKKVVAAVEAEVKKVV